MLTGGDSIPARRMREDYWSFDPTHKLVIVSNHKPDVHGTDHGIWRRIALVPFSVRFWDEQKGEDGPPALKADKTRKDRLKAEAEGILAWLVQGCLKWQRTGLAMPDAVRRPRRSTATRKTFWPASFPSAASAATMLFVVDPALLTTATGSGLKSPG